MDVHVVILAAGKGTRMKSAIPKVLHRVAGLPMIEHVLATAASLRPSSTTVIVGYQADVVLEALARRPGLTLVVQEPQLGTGHALLQAEPVLRGSRGALLLLSGDAPLLTTRTLETLLDHHLQSHAAVTVLTAEVPDPTGYGRIIRTSPPGKRLARIVEERDATNEERAIREINSGVYAFSLNGLFDALHRIGTENAQREYYLPDIVTIYRNEGQAVESVTVPEAREILGINSRSELAAVGRIMRDNKNSALMAAGVTIEDPATVYIDRDVTVGSDTVIRPGVSIEGATTIGSGCEIHRGVRITSSQIGDRAIILDHSVVVEARVASDATIGPFAHLRHGADVRERARVGNFVEMKKTVLGPGSKALHLAYLGDATIGEKVNIGAGVITCNYDGEKKQQTRVEDEAFIGSDSQLIAPVTVGKNAYVGTGATIREDVPSGALAVSAGKQRNIEGWVAERRKKRERDPETRVTIPNPESRIPNRE